MKVIDLLYFLSVVPPNEFNPMPGLSPVSYRKGLSTLNDFSPHTDAETALHATALPMFGRPTREQWQAFRLDLHAVYVEQGFTAHELADYFPEVT